MIASGGLSHLALRVTDLERAAKFYTGTLGFQEVMHADGLVLLNLQGTLVGLRGGEPETPPGDRFDPHRVGLDHLALAVEDPASLDEMRRQLDDAGVPNNGVQDDALTGARYIAFYDPDGIAWELYVMPGS